MYISVHIFAKTHVYITAIWVERVSHKSKYPCHVHCKCCNMCSKYTSQRCAYISAEVVLEDRLIVRSLNLGEHWPDFRMVPLFDDWIVKSDPHVNLNSICTDVYISMKYVVCVFCVLQKQQTPTWPLPDNPCPVSFHAWPAWTEPSIHNSASVLISVPDLIFLIGPTCASCTWLFFHKSINPLCRMQASSKGVLL